MNHKLMQSAKSDREKDIQALAAAVLDAKVNVYDNPNGPVETSCPYCFAEERHGYNKWPGMQDLKHEPDCAYLIARDLSTGHR